jgi:leucyl aminopeptidase (aminopeptidase T)
MDIESLAVRTIERLGVSRGQVISIWASTHSLDFIASLAFHIKARGAFYTLRLVMESLLQRVAADLSPAYLALVPGHELRWLQDIDAIIEVRDHAGHIPGAEISRRRAMAAEWIALIDEADRLHCRRFTVIHPTQALADAYHLPLVLLQERYWQAIDIDDGALDALQGRLAEQLSKTRQVHITTPLGTDLYLEVDGRPVYHDQDGLPRGEVYLAPHETSAEGQAVIERAFIRGQAIERLVLTFEKGQVVRIEACQQGSISLLEQLLEVSNGDKDRIAELGLGLNPGVKELTGDPMLDEKLFGSVHIAIGMNEGFGGQNRSNLHLDLVMLHPNLWLDGILLQLPG